MEWLSGKWQRIFNETTQYEVWEMQEEKLVGSFFYVYEGDTFITEEKEIKVVNDRLTLMVKMAENELFQSFPLEKHNGDLFVFKNPKHEYPEEIIYELTSSGHLVVKSSAVVNGFQKGVEYEFSRLH
ncbi:MAG: hypothetical protein CL843_13865 [Crocinitomicaceae bacterium]|nr:hypothetical protein [Crocinitomicaceae bacterium]